jgi:hypothetical protein
MLFWWTFSTKVIRWVLFCIILVQQNYYKKWSPERLDKGEVSEDNLNLKLIDEEYDDDQR